MVVLVRVTNGDETEDVMACNIPVMEARLRSGGARTVSVSVSDTVLEETLLLGRVWRDITPSHELEPLVFLSTADLVLDNVLPPRGTTYFSAVSLLARGCGALVVSCANSLTLNEEIRDRVTGLSVWNVRGRSENIGNIIAAAIDHWPSSPPDIWDTRHENFIEFVSEPRQEDVFANASEAPGWVKYLGANWMLPRTEQDSGFSLGNMTNVTDSISSHLFRKLTNNTELASGMGGGQVRGEARGEQERWRTGRNLLGVQIVTKGKLPSRLAHRVMLKELQTGHHLGPLAGSSIRHNNAMSGTQWRGKAASSTAKSLLLALKGVLEPTDDAEALANRIAGLERKREQLRMSAMLQLPHRTNAMVEVNERHHPRALSGILAAATYEALERHLSGRPEGRVCIIVRSYEGQVEHQYGLRALAKSIRGLHYPDWEVIIANTDDTEFHGLARVVAEMNDPRFRVLILNGLPAYSRDHSGYNVTERAIRRCRPDARWLLMTNGDNVYGPTFLDKVDRGADITGHNWYSRYLFKAKDMCTSFINTICRVNGLGIGTTDLGANVLNLTRWRLEGISLLDANIFRHSVTDGNLMTYLVRKNWTWTIVDDCAFEHTPNIHLCQARRHVWLPDLHTCVPPFVAMGLHELGMRKLCLVTPHSKPTYELPDPRALPPYYCLVRNTAWLR
eukprot:CAMPEP_0119149090 /NCGR_PEP_ID=MMETSP1310-20130426/42853_1 /TAXON_ID=464262 /ORGANISM="Genus nov. species nov., Strain RCC2339" /LENGTH=675 /DNA_ID=CAMNT_0007141171 /DNA_START=262 /DNA_END=2289 /DNA_ORIENTATION=+